MAQNCYSLKVQSCMSLAKDGVGNGLFTLPAIRMALRKWAELTRK